MLSEFKIGGIKWTSELMDEGWSNDARRLGQCDKDAHHIKVYEHPQYSEQARLFLHELLHALWYEYDVDLANLTPPDVEEKVVTAFSTGLAAFIAQNPTAMRAITKLLRST